MTNNFLNSPRQKALAFALFAAFIWGANAPITKLALGEVPIFLLITSRLGLSIIMFIPIIYKKLKIEKEDTVKFFWAALTGISLHVTLLFVGLKLTGAIHAAVLVAVIPIMTLAGANIFLKESISRRLVIASVIALLGTIIIVGSPGQDFDKKVLFGNLIILLSSAIWVVHEIISKKLLKKYSAETVAFYTISLGCLTLIPFAVFEHLSNPNWTNNLTQIGIGGILFGAIFAAFFANIAWQKGLQLLPAKEASFFFFIDPISGAILAMILLGEKLTIPIVIGGIFIFVAVLLAEHKRRDHPLHKKLS